MSRKWLTETVIQRYFKEEHGYYEAPIDGDETALEAARYNEPFDRFPDVYVAIDGREYPVEVEWRSSDFDHFDHDLYPDFIEQDGFVVVVERNEAYDEFAQLEIDGDHLRTWVDAHAERLLDETLASVRTERQSTRHPAVPEGEPSVVSTRVKEINENDYLYWQWREGDNIKDRYWQPVPDQ